MKNFIRRVARRLAEKNKQSLIRLGGISLDDIIGIRSSFSRDCLGESLDKNGRHALIALIQGQGLTGAELGVAEGYFSESILNNRRVSKLYSVDAWGDHHDSSEYLRACYRLSFFDQRCALIRSYFSDALALFSNESLDFIYFDAYAHTGQQDGRLFEDWYPKLKKGGLCSGHDYDPVNWPQTVTAVDKFAASLGKTVNIIPGISTNNPQDGYPSWFFYK